MCSSSDRLVLCFTSETAIYTTTSAQASTSTSTPSTGARALPIRQTGVQPQSGPRSPGPHILPPRRSASRLRSGDRTATRPSRAELRTRSALRFRNAPRSTPYRRTGSATQSLGRRRRWNRTRRDGERDAAPGGHFAAVPGQPKAGNVGACVHCALGQPLHGL